MGIGTTEQEAELDAWKNALYKAFNEGGLIGYKSQSKPLENVMSMEQLEVVVPPNSLPRRLVCQTLPIYLSGNRVKVYILLQVQRYAGRENDFSDLDGVVCESLEFSEALGRWNMGAYEEQRKKRKSEKRDESSFFRKKHNSYLAWGWISVGYPASIGSSFAGRHGGVVGVGYFLELGLDFVVSDSNAKSRQDGVAFLHYMVGIKFLPYKDFFLSAGYGTLGGKFLKGFNDNEGNWGLAGLRQSRGLAFTAGYDVITDADGAGFFLSLGAGAGYDLVMKRWMPLFNVKMGMAFGL